MIDFKEIKKKLLGQESDSSLNQSTKKNKVVIGFFTGLAALVIVAIIGSLAKEEKPASHHKKSKPATISGVISTDFTQKNELSALEQQQGEIKSVKSAISKLGKDFRSEIKRSQSETLKEAKAILNKRIKKEGTKHSAKEGGAMLSRLGHRASDINTKLIHSRVLPAEVELSSLSFHYRQPIDQEAIEEAAKKERFKYVKTPDNYVPATTHVRGVLLEGADANASVNGQSDTVGILVRLLDNGTLPNGKHSHLKGCNVLARVYGDISSERAEARLNRISCTKPDGTILDKKVQGYLSFAGKEGVKGTPIMRNGKIVFAAGFAGLLNSASSAAQMATQTQSVSALGTTTSVNSGQILGNIAAGAGVSSGKALEEYYIKLANQYHPIIEIGSGTKVTVIFQKGFSLLDEDSTERNYHRYSKHDLSRVSANQKQSEAEKIKRIMEKGMNVASQISGSSDAPFSNITQ